MGLLSFFFPALWPVPVAAGAVLIAMSVAARPKTELLLPGGKVKDGAMQLPEEWNEQQISLGMERYKGNAGLLGQYVDGIVSRFVMGQQAHTMEVRTKFLETFNRYATVSRESYKWKRYLEGGRAALEEDAEDLQAQIKLQLVKNELAGIAVDPELVELQKKSRRVELLLEIARTEKAIADLNKPDPPPPPQPPSAKEIRDRKKATLAAREKEVRANIEATKADTSLDEEQKQRKLNALDEKLAELHGEQTDLL